MSSSVCGVSSWTDDEDDRGDDLCTHMHDAYARAAACLSFEEKNRNGGGVQQSHGKPSS